MRIRLLPWGDLSEVNALTAPSMESRKTKEATLCRPILPEWGSLRAESLRDGSCQIVHSDNDVEVCDDDESVLMERPTRVKRRRSAMFDRSK